MKVLRVLNNNVVLSVNEAGGEVVLTGWGVGFGKKRGDPVDPTEITQTFVPENNRDSDHLGALMAAIPLDYVQLADALVTSATQKLDMEKTGATVVALADHLQMAVKRQSIDPGLAAMDNPLAVEVGHLYPGELEVAREMLNRVNDWLRDRGETPLPATEQTAIALHLVNAGFRTEDLAETYRMTGVFTQLFDVIESAYDITIDPNSMNAARFITHMRYFFVRAHKNEQLDEGMAVLRDSLQVSHPEAVNTADRLANVLELRLGVDLSPDEVTYLALHVARLAG